VYIETSISNFESIEIVDLGYKGSMS